MTADELMNVDRAFAALAQREGLGPAFTYYAAEDGILIRQGNQAPLVGRAAIAEAYGPITGSPLAWEPQRAEMAASGDLGYTYGTYTVHAEGHAGGQGVYVTIWRRQADGSWRYVLDGGAATPAGTAMPSSLDDGGGGEP